METSDYIAAGALAVAVFAAAVSLFSYYVAKDALNISKKEHKERYRDITAYFMEAYKWFKDEDLYVSFAIRFTNEATLQNSITNLELHLEYYDESKRLGRAKVDACFGVKPINLANETHLLEFPIVLSEKSAKSGWISFKLPQAFKKDFDVDLYKVSAKTTDGSIVTVDTHIINTV
ncbi:hypothetical protein [Vibrio campbellii]|uniref:hypothetical protein n=1 Tax=Vibrio campbellii TaxID=680 RepID=UPI0005EDD657|nr:hypothetical protein [Vibrio campbellii]